MLKAGGTQGRYCHINACQVFRAFVLVFSWYLVLHQRIQELSDMCSVPADARAGVGGDPSQHHHPSSAFPTRVGQPEHKQIRRLFRRSCLWQVLLAFGQLGL